MRNKYEIRGDVTTIFIDKIDGSRLEVLIDTADFELVGSVPMKWTVNGSQNKRRRNLYATGRTYVIGEKRKFLQMHRLIMNAKPGYDIDHINHNTLDNRRCNLRAVPVGKNIQNRKQATRKSQTGIRGVYPVKNTPGVYVADCRVGGKTIYLGRFTDIKVAEKAVIEARAKYLPYSEEALKASS
ncbi:hypothetical protein CLHUN_02250 [Ruminiclostridium hungatei]|uniref:HNH nuclease domain-containing protein n=1 Tax=Ruminiclostridium hungatei TaxID=48256 RepID=A0A1V4SR79_RUMHU|nr:hypothetical protein [Ruminiclostridium hungatei]OPX46409.1 hypothetical protein CLHUN_02250 [Ruminiclostridium hungatei]